MVKNIILILFIILSSEFTYSQINITFTGDVILTRGVDDKIKMFGDSILINPLKRFKKNGFFVINYEGTFTESNNAQKKIYNFKAKKQRAELLKKAGVTHVSIANNHINDFGKIGFENTLEAIKENKLSVLGETPEPKILKKGKYKSAVLSASLTSKSKFLSNKSKIFLAIKKFTKKNPSIPLIFYVHWGLELQSTPEEWQKDFARELVKNGVDAIIGHHPHVTQTIEFIGNVPVIYSLGNFVADAYLPKTTFSYIIELKIKEKILETNLIPIKLKSFFPGIIKEDEQLDYIKKYLFNSKNVSAIKQKDNWIIKPSSSIDFLENTDTWLFSSNKFIAALKKLKNNSHLLTLFFQNENSNSINLFGELSELKISDINNDGNVDILLGISKKVKFDPKITKRIQIYTYKNEILKPLWLGTKFIYNVEKFDVLNTNYFNYLRTIEKDKNGKKYQAIYKWDYFGFELSTINQLKQ